MAFPPPGAGGEGSPGLSPSPGYTRVGNGLLAYCLSCITVCNIWSAVVMVFELAW